MANLLRGKDERYAFLEWKKRWNNTKGPVTHVHQSENYVYLTNMMGTVIIDMDEEGSVEAYITQMTQALELLAKTKEEYDNAPT